VVSEHAAHAVLFDTAVSRKLIMTTRSAEPSAMSPSRRRSPWPWVIAGAVVVVAVVLTSGDGGSGDRSAAPTSTAAGKDQSDPQQAAEDFAAAAGTGSGDALLALTCVGHPICVREHAPDMTDAQLAEAQDFIREGVYELAEHLKGAEFTTAVDGAEPDTKNVPYRTPAMTGDAYLTLTFVQSDGDWLYVQTTE
jgi:hypothetical protein